MEVFKNYADGELDIRDLLDLVSIEVSNMEASDGALRQTIEIINRGFFKVLEIIIQYSTDPFTFIEVLYITHRK